MEVINHVVQKYMYIKGVRRFDSLIVFVQHAHEQYDAMNITNIQIVSTVHI